MIYQLCPGPWLVNEGHAQQTFAVGMSVASVVENSNEKKQLPQVSRKYVYTGSKFSQWYSGLAVNSGVFCVGCIFSWTATAIPDLKASGAIGEITDSAESWISAISFVGGLLACLVSGFVIQQIGLRTTMLLQTLPLFGTWVVIIFSRNVTMMMVGRFFTGFFACGIAVAAPAFVAESSEVHLRGKLCFGYDVLGSFGHFYVYFVGAFITQSWRWQAICCAVPPIIFHALMMMVPESPSCLLRRGRSEEAYQALCWFRDCAKTTDESQRQMVKNELSDMMKSVERQKFNGDSSKTWSQRYLNSQTLKPTLLGMLLMIFFQLTGAMAVFAYTIEIFQDAGSGDGQLGSVILGFVTTVFTIFAGFFVEKLGRKVLLLSSELLTSLPLILLGTYIYLREEGGEQYTNFVNQYNWIPVLALVLYCTFFAIGMAPVSWVVVGELVPPTAKGFSSGIISVTTRTFGFLVVLFFKDLIQILGQYGCYWFFAVCCVFGAVFIGLFIPETKGKSLDEINRKFMSKSTRGLGSRGSLGVSAVELNVQV